MPETWLTSDPHFGHDKCCTEFKRKDGSPLRPFKDGREMDEELVKRWNERVAPHDKVYLLGDVAIKKQNVATLGRLHGRIKLVMANHDIFGAKEYLKYCYDVCAFRKIDNIVLTHIPLHPDSISERGWTNVHGHYHDKRVLVDHPRRKREKIIDPRYLCVSVEQTDYYPITWGEALERIAAQRLEFEHAR